MRKSFHVVMLALAIGLALIQTATAQTATVLVDAPAGTTLAEAMPWQWTLYVNNTAFPLTTTCGIVGAIVTCQGPLPNVSTALTPTGNQNFEATYRTVLFGESPRSIPFVATRRGAPSAPRIQ